MVVDSFSGVQSMLTATMPRDVQFRWTRVVMNSADDADVSGVEFGCVRSVTVKTRAICQTTVTIGA